MGRPMEPSPRKATFCMAEFYAHSAASGEHGQISWAAVSRG
jgi:hypothetical protein